MSPVLDSIVRALADVESGKARGLWTKPYDQAIHIRATLRLDGFRIVRIPVRKDTHEDKPVRTTES